MEPILLVYKRSTWEIYHKSPDADVRAYLESGAPDVATMHESHEAQARALDAVHAALAHAGLGFDSIYRADLAPVAGRELVIALGGDGTFLEVSHYVADTPLCGVNSDPHGSTGYFCAATGQTFAALLAGLERTPRTRLHRLALVVDGRPVPQLVLNEVLFAHPNPASTSRYRLTASGETRELRTSGLLACTAAGSTAWMYQEGGEVMPLDSDLIQYLPRGSRAARPRFARTLALRSLTRLGRLYVDGPHLAHECGLGSEVTLGPGRPLTVVGDVSARRGAYG
jgi:NAD+ kinase